MKTVKDEFVISDSCSTTTVVVAYQYEPPSTRPAEGHDWDHQKDVPGISVSLSIPTETGSTNICQFLRDKDIDVFEQPMLFDWGSFTGHSSQCRRRCKCFMGILAEAEQQARDYAATEIEKLRQIAERRRLRIEQRELSIKYHCSRTLNVTPED